MVATGIEQLRTKRIVGDEDRPPTADELKQMREIVDDAMSDGALGVSTSLIYAPAFYAKTDELIELAKVASAKGGAYATHMRNESDHENAAIDEALRIGKEANIPVEIFHLKVAGKQNWGKMKDIVATYAKNWSKGGSLERVGLVPFGGADATAAAQQATELKPLDPSGLK